MIPSEHLKFGPSPFVSQDSPEWAKQWAAQIPSKEEQKQRVLSNQKQPLPSSALVDLFHLSQQPFAHNVELLKRWFLTAFVTKEDQLLLDLPENPNICHNITAQISSINNTFNQPEEEITQEALQDLKTRLCALFKTSQWLGVALNRVDQGALSIDTLNTLLLWQASIIQFGEAPFTLYMATEQTPLKARSKEYVPSCQPLLLHQVVFADITLGYTGILASEWGRLAYQRVTEPLDEWKRLPVTIETLIGGLPYYVTNNEQKLSIHYPSIALLYGALRNTRQQVLPIFAFGYLPYEAFNAAAFFGARLVQAYLPNAKSNLYAAHDQYLGPSLMPEHDFFHLALSAYRADNQQALLKKMKIAAILANALVRFRNVEAANTVIDKLFPIGDDSYVSIGLLIPTSSQDQLENLLVAVYTELVFSIGVIPHQVHCIQENTNENSKPSFRITILFEHNVPVSFLVNDIYKVPLYAHLEQLQSTLRCTATSSTSLTGYSAQPIASGNIPKAGPDLGGNP